MCALLGCHGQAELMHWQMETGFWNMGAGGGNTVKLS